MNEEHDATWQRLSRDAWAVMLEQEHDARTVINLVASENAQSTLSRLPYLLDCAHRYYFRAVGSQQDWGFRGGGAVAELEQGLAVPLLQAAFGAPFISVRPLSGLSAMLTVFSALGGPPGTACLTLGAAQGGHSVTVPLAGRLGLDVSTMPGRGPHELDLDAVTALVARTGAELVYLDQSNALLPYLDVAALRAAVDAAGRGTRIHVDCSHWLGLILGGVLPNPLDSGADSIGGSTHKTFPGPQKGFFATRSEDVWDRFRAAEGTLISSHHLGGAVSLALALAEFAGEQGRRYAADVVRNGRLLGAALSEGGIEVYGADLGYTRGHQLWIDPSPLGTGPADAAERLHRVGIRVTNLPYLPGFERPSIRLGVHEATHLGLPAEQIPALAELMVAGVRAARPAEQLAAEVAKLRAGWPTPGGREDLVRRHLLELLGDLQPAAAGERG
ncbi:hypothetical protein [Actinoplanes sp. NPDC026619]|uniref:hypothetical protein n=1 Tax=Actinoplanes sp. NPDC026619 TaxID=3155798 RepID=UPI0033E63AC1